MLVRIGKNNARVEMINGNICVNGAVHSNDFRVLMGKNLDDAKKVNPEATHVCGQILLNGQESEIVKVELKKWKERNLPGLFEGEKIYKKLIEKSIKIEIETESSYDDVISHEETIDSDLAFYKSSVDARVQLYLSAQSIAVHSSNYQRAADAKKIMKMLEDGANIDDCKKLYSKIK